MSEGRPDQVSIEMGGGHNLMPIDKWIELPLSRRTRLIIDNKVCFLRGAAIVPVREALQSLRGSKRSET